MEEVTMSPDTDAATWPRTVFDTDEWVDAWSRATVERQRPLDRVAAPLYLLEYSPFWRGYEVDTGLEPVWERPVVTVSSLYSAYGPGHLAGSPETVAAVVDCGLQRAAEHGACGVLVLNVPAPAAGRWAEVRPPDRRIRLDFAYHQMVGTGPDGLLGDISSHERTEWRRRWRRSTEQGVRLVEETDPPVARIDEVVALANGSAVKHGWPELYDRTTLTEVLGVPGGRLVRAEWDGRTIAGFVTLEHDRKLYLWAGGMDHTVVREVSPYLFLLYELLAAGRDRGWERVEFGKGNDEFKRRHGFASTELCSLWYPASPGDAEVYGPRLEKLHDGLASFMGL
jgi:hypothetical protein